MKKPIKPDKQICKRCEFYHEEPGHPIPGCMQPTGEFGMGFSGRLIEIYYTHMMKPGFVIPACCPFTLEHTIS